MSKHHKDTGGDHHRESQPIVTLTPDSAVSDAAADGPAAQEKDREVKLQAGQGLDVGEKQSQTGAVESLDQKDKELAELKDKYLRSLAEAENMRRRIRQQSEESIRLQRENILRELLPIVDNLERAVAAARGGGNGKSILEGVEMVLASMMDFLKRNGVTPQPAVGMPFDPARHEAVDQVASDSHPPNTVVEEHHRGYMIGDRVLRPARVVVAKAVGSSGQA